MSNEDNDNLNDNETLHNERSWVEETEEIRVAAAQLVSRVRELLKESSVRRLIIRKLDNEILMEIPLTSSVVVGVASIIVWPLAVLGGLAMTIGHFRIEIVRVKGVDETPDSATSDE